MNMNITIDATDEEVRSLNELLDIIAEHGEHLSDCYSMYGKDFTKKILTYLRNIQVSKEE